MGCRSHHANMRARFKRPTALDLAIFELIREPGKRYTLQQIAAACGCHRNNIFYIEKQALAKMKRHAERNEVSL